MSEKAKELKTDETEGARVRALKEALNHSVEKILGGWKASLFAKCFPSLSTDNEAVLEAIRVSVVEAVRRAIYEDIGGIIEEEGVAGPLEELSALVKNYAGPKYAKAWRPSGEPVADARAHDAKFLQHEKQRLLESLESHRKGSEELLQRVKSGRKECRENQKEIQSRLSALKELSDVCGRLQKEKRIAFCNNMFFGVDLPHDVAEGNAV
ncbi:uncharacterized protein LOC125042621 [Penaeus chinensis]|uniref:uncharacterized protein LOC125042621 n=1 Tax=Penaeus chinensis TaxID=139456 RepID=UPI001FB7E373|nr:uncharacterized protein LOC125042621 [Penaeus chinensis]